MKLKSLFTDDDAVSPVIGVILMVAITVILAAVIGAFVLDLGSNTQDTPQASFNFEYNPSGGDGFAGTDDEVSITHQSGDSLDATLVSVTVDGAIVSSSSDLGYDSGGFSDPIRSGSTVTITENTNNALATGASVRVTWESEDGSTSSTLAEGEIP